MGLMEKRADRSEGLRRHLELSERLAAEGPLDLIVWSETSVAGGVYEQDAEAVYRMLFTERLKVPVLFGALLMRDVADARRRTLFNSALMSDGRGHITGRYDKQALLAFGEYLPLGSTFPIVYEWSPNTGKFTPGTTLAPLPLGEHHVSAHICLEDVLPGVVNDLVRGSGADLLVNITNDAWYGDTTQPWIHLALATFRAIEHRRFLVRSTNSGVSAFVDPAGRVLAHTDTFERAALSHEIAYLEPGRTPYELYGNAPWWACTVAMGALCVVRRQRRLERSRP
jgi:apolipoprotein N-acyltransferase